MLYRVIIVNLVILMFSACNKTVLEDVQNWQGDFKGAKIHKTPGKCAEAVGDQGTVFTVSNTANKIYSIDFTKSPPTVISSNSTGSNPSRTTIDDKGRVWVGNRDSATATCYYEDASRKLQYCFSDKHISTGGGPRVVAAEKIDDDYTNIFIGSYTSAPFLTRIKVGGSKPPYTKEVFQKSIKLLSEPTRELKGYGGVYSATNKILWVADRPGNKLVGIKDLSTSNPKVAHEIDLSGICDGNIYGIGLTDVYQLPVGACIGGSMVQIVDNLQGGFNVLSYTLSARGRGIGTDTIGNAWVTMDTSNKVARVKLSETCANKKYDMTCTGGVCTQSKVTSRTPSGDCITYGRLPSGTTPLGVSADRSGFVYIVGYANATIYRMKANASVLSYDQSVKFSTGNAYMYSDFTGFTTGFVADTSFTDSLCAEKPFTLIQAKYDKNDNRNAISVNYFCSDKKEDTGTYKALPSMQRLEDCIGKKCINFKVAFEGTEVVEKHCQTKISDIELQYKVEEEEKEKTE